MESIGTDPLEESRGKTDKSLEHERNKTNKVIDQKSSTVEARSDQKTKANRIAADLELKHTRAAADLNSTHQDVLDERLRSDKAQLTARSEEDRIRNKERLQKRLIAEALLESERQETDNNLLEERERTDVSHDITRQSLITRDQFLAIVSHDLRNPLSAISMGAELMRSSLSKRLETGESLKFLDIIERNVANMDRMISDLLDVERMANNRLELHLEKNNIGELLRECADLFAPVALGKGFKIQIEQMTQPILAQVDHDKILQVLSNLIGNALKFSPKGSVIKLSARTHGNEIEISVSDNGPGIPAEKIAQIFDRFSQLKTNDRRGLGLGLFISKWIVEAHNGKIRVNSEVGQGSTFTFTLPPIALNPTVHQENLNCPS